MSGMNWDKARERDQEAKGADSVGAPHWRKWGDKWLIEADREATFMPGQTLRVTNLSGRTRVLTIVKMVGLSPAGNLWEVSG